MEEEKGPLGRLGRLMPFTNNAMSVYPAPHTHTPMIYYWDLGEDTPLHSMFVAQVTCY